MKNCLRIFIPTEAGCPHPARGPIMSRIARAVGAPRLQFRYIYRGCRTRTVYDFARLFIAVKRTASVAFSERMTV
jgi:hypothetical protein